MSEKLSARTKTSSLAESEMLKEKAQKNDPGRVSYFSLYSYADKYDYVAIVLGLIGAVANGVTFPLFSLVFGEMVDALGTDDADTITEEVNKLSLYFVYIAVVSLVASFFEVAMFMWSGVRQAGKLRQAYLEAALQQDITFYETEATSGDILTGLNESCSSVQNAISEKVGNVVHHATTFIASLIIIFIRGWKLSLVMVSLLPLIGAAGAILATVLNKGSKEASEAYGKASTASTQAIANVRTVASFQAEETMWERYKRLLSRPRQIMIRVSTFNGAAGGAVNGVVFLTYGIAFWYGAKLVREDSDYTGGVVMNVIFGAIIGGFSLGQGAPNFAHFAAGRVAGEKVLSLIRRVPPISLDAGGEIPSKPLLGDIALTDVSFSYPARDDVVVFQALNMHVSPGQNVALVGASGSGKSTVIQLLERFYDPHAGRVTVDGYDLRTLDLGWYRDQIGLVSQEPTLFATTIRENILMGRTGASEEDVEAAARSANAHHFVSALPEGYDTQVGERGVQLSGGQKQRIAIARALLKNPRILLLDEATSALDTVSERLVQSALETLAEGRTTIVVAHRLSTIRNADKICVMQNGGIVEEGTHADLYAKEDSVYHSLVQLQQQAMDARAEAGPDAPDAVDADALLAAERAQVADLVAQQVVASVSGRDSGVRASDVRASDRRLSTKNGTMSLEADDFGEVLAGARPAPEPVAKQVATKALAATGEEEDEKALTDEEKAAAKGVGFVRLLNMNKREWPFLFIGTVASAALGTVMPLFAVILSTLIAIFYYPPDRLDEAEDKALRYSIYFYALGLGYFLIGTLQGRMFAIVGANLAERVRLLFYRAVLYMEVAWFDQDVNSSGALAARLATDAPRVRGAVGDVLGLVVQNVVTLVTGYIIAFISGWRMALVITASLPFLAFSSYMQIKFFTGLDNKGDQVYAQANQTAHEGILSLRTVHSYNLQSSVATLYRDLLQAPNAKANRNALLSGAAFGFGQFIMFAVYALAFWYGGIEVERHLDGNGGMSIEDMLKTFFAILLATMGISQAQVAFPDVAKGKSAVARVFRVVDRESLIDASNKSGDTPDGAVRGDVELRDVVFAYPTRPDILVFNQFTLRAEPGKFTALVGESGSGKSTIINLVERFYDVTAGGVFIDGHDVRSLQIDWLRARVGLVSQEPALFNGTILENIRLGNPEASLDDVRKAATVANAVDFIEAQPDAYGTLLGEGGGISLSGGQRQRIAIARAVLKDPRILLLDEATSALDAESERIVQDALNKLMEGRTSIVVAHRLTTIRTADKIAVVQQGVVLEQGSHDELMGKGEGGAYIKLARAQAM